MQNSVPVRAVLNAFMYSAQEALAKRDKISLVVFETFEVRERAAREGKTLKIAASKVSVFKPGKALIDKVNG